LPSAAERRVLPKTLERCCRLRAGESAAEVDVLGEARAVVPQVGGDLTGRQSCLVEPGGHGLAEDVRGDPVEARPVGVLRRAPLVLFGSRSPPWGVVKTTVEAADGRPCARRRSSSTTKAGSARMRRPAVVLGNSWIARRRPGTRITVASIRSVPA
jgi:hypothetical protein